MCVIHVLKILLGEKCDVAVKVSVILRFWQIDEKKGNKVLNFIDILLV